MKIILDTDGTLTDFNQFIKDNAIEYFEKKYDLQVIYPDKLEIEEIFDIKNVLMNNRGYSESQAQLEMKQMLDKYWISLRFVKFSLFSKFRPGVTNVINSLIKQGHDVQVHTSRAKTCNNDIVGKIAREFTIWQYRMNGIYLPEDKFHFYHDDYEKLNGILEQKPQIVFEDKPEIINQLCMNHIHTICVDGNHNKEVEDSSYVKRIEVFELENVFNKLKELLGLKLNYYNREATSNLFYNNIKKVRPIALSYFNPIILNEQNLVKLEDEGVIYSPNHRSTLDPVAIMSYLDANIHWAALLRFFQGNDSIFNNSKNPLLCKITSTCFKRLEYFPIDRKSDNPDANNYQSIKDMSYFLKIASKIGIFPEGTTRRPKGCEFGTFDDAFLLLAKQTNSWVQPITTLWIKELGLKSKVIINFGPAFKLDNMTVGEAMDYFRDIQSKALDENKQKREELSKKYVKSIKKF